MPPQLLSEGKDSDSRPMVQTSLDRTGSLVVLNEIPLLKLFDLTKRSHNMQKVKQGQALRPEDLEYSTIADEKIKQQDLEVIEMEVNKKKRKREKALINGEMISPLATSRETNSRRSERRQNPFRQEEEQDLEANVRDQMMVD